MRLRFTPRELLWLTANVTGTLWSLEDLYERVMGDKWFGLSGGYVLPWQLSPR